MRSFVALWPAIRNIAALQQENCGVFEPMADRNDGQTAVSLQMLLRMHDDCGVLQLEKSILEHSGREVLVGSNRAEGLKLAKNCNVDLAVLDHEMPR